MHPVASPTAASSPSTAPPFTEGALHIANAQIYPILLAPSTALTLDFASTTEVDNEHAPPPSHFHDNPIAGVPTAAVSPLANQPTAGSSHSVKVQLNPILLALSTALTLDLESTDEVDNEDTPSSSQSLDNPMADVPTVDIPAAHSPTGEASDGNPSMPSTPTSGWRTARINSILTACYEELDKILIKAVGEIVCSV